MRKNDRNPSRQVRQLDDGQLAQVQGGWSISWISGAASESTTSFTNAMVSKISL
jgi:hypothetical protein